MSPIHNHIRPAAGQHHLSAAAVYVADNASYIAVAFERQQRK